MSAGPEIVDRNLDSELAQAGHGVFGACELLDDARLGDLEQERLRRHRVAGEQLCDRIREARID